MHERLIEGWLDRVTERAYQIPFCQMLLAKNHKVVLSTRHSPIEFGKDIISVNENGEPCAFQLKGNPGGRLSKSGFQAILPQVLELIHQPIVFSGVPSERHIAYIVTNGEIDEEAVRAVDDLNRVLEKGNHASKRLELITRGTILSWAKELGANLWPSEFEDLNLLLNILTHDGRGPLPFDKLHLLLSHSLAFDNESNQSDAQIGRRITSSSILTAIALKTFSEKENHFALISGWVFLASYIISICEKTRISYEKYGKPTVDVLINAIDTALEKLALEAQENKTEWSDFPLADGLIHRHRMTLIGGLSAIYWFRREEIGWQSEEFRNSTKAFILANTNQLLLWGEGAIPQILFSIWALGSFNPTRYSDQKLTELLESFVQLNKKASKNALPGPYYSLEDSVRHQFPGLLESKKDPIEGDNLGRDSFYLDTIFYSNAKRYLKDACKNVWVDYSKMSIRRFVPKHVWQFCLWRSAEGKEVTTQNPFSKKWEDVVSESNTFDLRHIPKAFVDQWFLLALFLLCLPHRGDSNIFKFLASKMDK